MSLDLLSSSDLEALRGDLGQRTTSHHQHQDRYDRKRYLILTYATAFDRVHYPLPLHLQSAADLDHQFDDEISGKDYYSLKDAYDQLKLDFEDQKRQYDESIDKLAQVLLMIPAVGT